MNLTPTILKVRARPVGTGSLQSVCVGSLEYGESLVPRLGFFFCMLSDVCLGSKPRKMTGYLPVIRGEAVNGSPFLLPLFYLSLSHSFITLVAKYPPLFGRATSVKMLN
jgi:hypothetical protein